MDIIKTVAPIAIDDLKKYFVNKDTMFVIEYKDSKLKGSKLLTYLSNLDIPSDILIDEDSEEYTELLKDYMNSPFLLNIETLEKAVIKILLVNKGLAEDEYSAKFSVENKEIVERWTNVLDSLTLYNMYTVNAPGIEDFVKSFNQDEGTSLVGINFVSLLKHEEFYQFYEIVRKSHLTYYQGYFNDYMFKGKNLYNYWANEHNPLFLLVYGIAAGVNVKEFLPETA